MLTHNYPKVLLRLIVIIINNSPKDFRLVSIKKDPKYPSKQLATFNAKVEWYIVAWSPNFLIMITTTEYKNEEIRTKHFPIYCVF